MHGLMRAGGVLQPSMLLDTARQLVYFHHIPKTGGSSFVDDASDLVPALHGCGKIHCASRKQLFAAINDWRTAECNFVACEGGYSTAEAGGSANLALSLATVDDDQAASEHRYANASIGIPAGTQLLLLLRSPRTHVLSQYAHCQQPGAEGQLLHGFPNITLGGWLSLAETRNESSFTYCGYDPLNLQASSMSNKERGSAGVLEQARAFVDSAHFVGLLESYELSLCLLSHSLNATLPAACDCALAPAGGGTPALASTDDTHGTHTAEIELSDSELSAIDRLTVQDAELHEYARTRFFKAVQDASLDCWLSSDSSVAVSSDRHSDRRSAAVARAAARARTRQLRESETSQERK